MDFTLKQAQALVEMFGGGDPDCPGETVTVFDGAGEHSGAGLYAFNTEYPEEGAIKLG